MKHKTTTAPRPADRPPDDFCEWWNPTGEDAFSGASIGGHPDAYRVWARKDPGRWARRHYGANAVVAWTCQCYRDEYYAWVQSGRPAGEEFVSLCAPLPRVAQFWHELGQMLRNIGKPMPKPLPTDKEVNKHDEPIEF